MADVKPEELDRLIRNSAFDNEYKNLLLKLESKISNDNCKMQFTSATEKTLLAKCELLFFDEHKILEGTMEIDISNYDDEKGCIKIHTETCCDENETNRLYIESKLGFRVENIRYTEKYIKYSDISLETLYDMVNKQYQIYWLADLLVSYKYDIVKVDNVVKSIKVLNSNTYKTVEKTVEKIGFVISVIIGTLLAIVIEILDALTYTPDY